jgi:hypothetical protein
VARIRGPKRGGLIITWSAGAAPAYLGEMQEKGLIVGRGLVKLAG